MMSGWTAATCSGGAPDRASSRITASALAEIPCGFSTAKWKVSVPSGRRSSKTWASDSQAGTRLAGGKGRRAIRGGTSWKRSAMSISAWMRSARSERKESASNVCDSFSGITAVSAIACPLLLGGDAHQVAPLRPAAVIVAHLAVAQELGVHEPGVAAPLADPAVDDDVVLRGQLRLALVEPAQFLGGLEGAVVGVDRPRPGDVGGARDVTAAERPLVRVLRHVQPLAAVLLRAPDVDQLALLLDVRQDLVAEGAHLFVVPLRGLVVGRRIARHLLGQGAPLLDPLDPAAVHDLDLVVAEEAEDPEGVGRPPVVAVAIEDDGGVLGGADPPQQRLEPRAPQVVAPDRIIQVARPVHLHRPRQVPGGVEQRVLVRLGETEPRVVQVLGDPLGRDQRVWVTVSTAFDFAHDRISFPTLGSCICNGPYHQFPASLKTELSHGRGMHFCASYAIFGRVSNLL